MRVKNLLKRKVAESEENFDSALEKALQCLSHFGMSRKLRTEQTKAIRTLVSRGDLLAVLPTGFGKSLIFQVLVSCEGNSDVSNLSCDRCVPVKKHCARSDSRSVFDGIDRSITCE